MTAEGYLEGELFLGKIAAKQNLEGVVVKLAREQGAKAAELRARAVGTVTRAGAPVAGGRIGGWRKRRKEMDRVNVAIRRGRTVPNGGYEFARAPVGPDGRFELVDLEPGAWFLAFEPPGAAPTVVGPVELTAGGEPRTVDLAVVDGGAVEGRVEHIPPAQAGHIWVVAFDRGIVRREARVAPDGTFRLEHLPPGRYGLKAGHDAYEDPHVPRGELKPEDFRKGAEPWQGAVIVEVEPGGTARGVILDLGPPGPLVEPDAEQPK